MKRMWTVLAALCLVLITTDGARAISSPSGIDPRLRFEYEVGRTRQGKPEIQGYIYNDYARPANNVRMIVETLDESGQVTSLEEKPRHTKSDLALVGVAAPVDGLGDGALLALREGGRPRVRHRRERGSADRLVPRARLPRRQRGAAVESA